MRRLISATVVAAALAAVPSSAHAASFVIRGAGYGHGIGMSQYGAYGYAKHGYTHEQILRAYYTDTELGVVSPRPSVRVLLQSGRSSYNVKGVSRAGDVELDRDLTYRVSSRSVSRSGKVLARAGEDEAMVVSAPEGGSFRLSGTSSPGIRNGRYRGSLEVRDGKAINIVGLEDYLRGVVPAESPASWPIEALKAQAVAARTYAITTKASGRDGFDQYADVRSQVYRGVKGEHRSTDEAIEATRGQIVLHGGQPVATFFFSTSGGFTENIENSFIGSVPRPWLQGVRDPFDDASPKHRWRLKMSASAAARRLRGLYRGSFRGIRVVKRGESPRVVRAQVLGTRGNRVTTGPELRRRLGLYDTWASFSYLRSSKSKERPAPAPRDEAPPEIGEPGGVEATASSKRMKRVRPPR